MRRILPVLLCALLCSGCALYHAAPPAAPVETPDWPVVTTDAADFGITYDDALFQEVGTYPLDQLTACCLGSDGVYAEEAFDLLYRRFIQAPNTCVTYFSLIQDREALRTLCGQIAGADVAWYDRSQAFQDSLEQLKQTYPDGPAGQVVTLLQEEYESSLKDYGFLP